LKQQFPKAKELLNAMGIKYLEIDNYEADDIIGTFAKYCDMDKDFIGTIISSDKDLLQLISNDIDIKLLKQKDYIRYNESSFKEEYQINPINIIDLKALMGDSSDNIPGVKGIGEKTALKLLQEYKTLDGIYNNIDNIKGKTKEKLLLDKDNAYMSYDIATICKDVPIDINIHEYKYTGKTDQLNEIYEELEFYSFLKKESKKEDQLKVEIINDVDKLKITEDSAIYLELSKTNYHTAQIIGLGIYNKNNAYYIPFEILKHIDFLKNINLYTYDIKKTYVALKWNNMDLDNMNFDLMLAASLLEYNVKDDIAYLSNQLNFELPFHEASYKKEIPENVSNLIVSKAKFIYENKEFFENKIKEEKMEELLFDIEIPLAYVLGDMEFAGVNIDKNVLNEMKEDLKIKLESLQNSIYKEANCEFNISSPMQLGEVLFDKLNLPHSKKGKNGYSTAIDVLNKLKGAHPIIDLIIEYRMLSKLYTTYIEGLENTINKDNKIHTIYTQALTRTGRLSSIEPNLQNIPIRTEYGRLIRKAFVPSDNSIIISGDYSQIELRILAHMANVKPLIDAFNNEIDIHSKTACDIFDVSIDSVTKEQRRVAKSVNFGIIYGISSFGLSENLNIDKKQAQEFIDKYLNTYPGIKDYMDYSIKQAYEKGYSKTLFNRKRNIDELKNTNYMIRQSGERIALNTPIQGTSADIIKKAMVQIHKEFKNNNLKSKMIIQVHDELVFDCIKDEKDKVIDIMTNIMENVCKLNVPLKIDIEYGDNWYEAK